MEGYSKQPADYPSIHSSSSADQLPISVPDLLPDCSVSICPSYSSSLITIAPSIHLYWSPQPVFILPLLPFSFIYLSLHSSFSNGLHKTSSTCSLSSISHLLPKCYVSICPSISTSQLTIPLPILHYYPAHSPSTHPALLSCSLSLYLYSSICLVILHPTSNLLREETPEAYG